MIYLKLAAILAGFVAGWYFTNLGVAICAAVVVGLVIYWQVTKIRYTLMVCLLISIIVPIWFTQFRQPFPNLKAGPLADAMFKFDPTGYVPVPDSPVAKEALKDANDLMQTRQALEQSTQNMDELDRWFVKDNGGWRWAKFRFSPKDGKGLPIYQKEEAETGRTIEMEIAGEKVTRPEIETSWHIDPVWVIDPKRAVKVKLDEQLRYSSEFGVLIFFAQPMMTENRIDGQVIKATIGQDYVTGWILAEFLSEEPVDGVDQAGAYGLELQEQKPEEPVGSQMAAAGLGHKREQQASVKSANITIEPGDIKEMSDWTHTQIVPKAGEIYRIGNFDKPEDVERVFIRRGSARPVKLVNPRYDESGEYYARFNIQPGDGQLSFILKEGEPLNVQVERI